MIRRSHLIVKVEYTRTNSKDTAHRWFRVNRIVRTVFLEIEFRMIIWGQKEGRKEGRKDRQTDREIVNYSMIWKYYTRKVRVTMCLFV